MAVILLSIEWRCEMFSYVVKDVKGNVLGVIETTCLKYAERIAKDEYPDYYELMLPYL